MIRSKQTRKPFLLLVFVVCLALGFTGGARIGKADVLTPLEALEAATAGPLSVVVSNTSAGTPVSNGQQNILIVGVDRLEQASPRLMSLWLVMYIPSTPNLTLLPLYPASLETGPAQDSFLETAFRLTGEWALDPTFLEALQARDLWWNHYIVLDEIALAEFIDIAGGIKVMEKDEILSGVQAIASITSPWNDPQQALYDQSSLIGALCASSVKVSQVNPAYLLELLSHHLRTDFDSQSAVLEWQKLGRTTGHVTCKFPTIEQEMSN